MRSKTGSNSSLQSVSGVAVPSLSEGCDMSTSRRSTIILSRSISNGELVPPTTVSITIDDHGLLFPPNIRKGWFDYKGREFDAIWDADMSGFKIGLSLMEMGYEFIRDEVGLHPHVLDDLRSRLVSVLTLFGERGFDV